MTLKLLAANMHIHNTVSLVAAVIPINVKIPEVFDDIILFLVTFNANVTLTPIVAVFHLVGISSYFISEQNILRMTWTMLDVMA